MYFMFPVNSNWASWQPWNQCSVTCGSGTTTKKRTCTNPAPVGTGGSCQSSNEEELTCTPHECIGIIDWFVYAGLKPETF